MKRMYLATGILGLALVVAPFALGFSTSHPAFYTSVIVGAGVILVSAIKALLHDDVPWEYWAAGLLGILVAGSPFALGFTNLTRALLTTVILGVLLFLLSGYQVFFAENRFARSKERNVENDRLPDGPPTS